YLQGKQILEQLESSITADNFESRVLLIYVQPLEDIPDETNAPETRVRYLILHQQSTGKTYFVDLFRILAAGKADIIRQLQKIFDKALVVGYDLQQSGVLLKSQHKLTLSNPFCLKTAMAYIERATGKSCEDLKRKFSDRSPKPVFSDLKSPRTSFDDCKQLVSKCSAQAFLFDEIVTFFQSYKLLSESSYQTGQMKIADNHFELEMKLLQVLIDASSTGLKVNKKELERLQIKCAAVDNDTHNSILLSLLNNCGEPGQVVHTYFHSLGSSTGRLSSSNPNIMGIDRTLHHCILPHSRQVLLCADYSQIEPRIAAAYTQEEPLLRVFREGKDIYREIASSLFQIATDSVDTETRSKIKTMFLGLLYGMGAKALQKRLLDQGIDVTISEAKELIINFKNTYTKLGGIIDGAGKLAGEQKKAGGMITARTMTGRPITINATSSEESELRAHNFNHIIQGTGADILKLAAVEFHKRIREAGLRAQIVNLVHDEILVEVSREDRDRVQEILVDVMQSVGRSVIGIETPVKCGVGSNWRIAKGE
ncbi:MAG TPA: DNA polymerase A family protein, partial [Mesotoga infera]|nr:DNA polymerase A family protein [Mesotoga infera]